MIEIGNDLTVELISPRLEEKQASNLPEDSKEFRLIRVIGTFYVADAGDTPSHVLSEVHLSATYTADDVGAAGSLSHLLLGITDGESWDYISAAELGATSTQGGTVDREVTGDFYDPAVGWGAGGN